MYIYVLHFRSCILFFLPFFLLELFGFLEFFLSAGTKICCSVIFSQSIEKLVQKTDLLFFLGNKEKTGREKVLCLQAAKIYFGSAIQLCYQIWILQVTHYSGEFKRISQYLSIIMSFVMITKNSIGLMSYSRTEEENADGDEDFSISKVAKTLSLYFSWLPLILTSLLFKIGTINLFILFFGWYSLIIGLGIFSVNLSSIFIYASIRNKSNEFASDQTNKKIKDKSQLSKFLISYSNIFVISRPINTLRY